MSPFEKAFAAARKAGEKEFTFNGKRYNTRRADDPPTRREAVEEAREKAAPVGSGGKTRPELEMRAMQATAAPPEGHVLQQAHQYATRGLGHFANVTRDAIGLGPVEGGEGLRTVERLGNWVDEKGRNVALGRSDPLHRVAPHGTGLDQAMMRAWALRQRQPEEFML